MLYSYLIIMVGNNCLYLIQHYVKVVSDLRQVYYYVNITEILLKVSLNTIPLYFVFPPIMDRENSTCILWKRLLFSVLILYFYQSTTQWIFHIFFSHFLKWYTFKNIFKTKAFNFLSHYCNLILLML